MRTATTLTATVLVVVLAGCGSTEERRGSTAEVDADVATTSTPDVAFDEALHDELVAMLEADQEERLGAGPLDDADRTERLKQIVAEHGWPTISLVGEDGEDAAWAIAQHSDHDPEFQARAVQLIGEAVERGDASPGNLAYLTDRVAVGSGQAQTYGTQVGCGPDGPEPATPIADEAVVDAARARVGLAPLSDYLEEMARICAQDEL
ncbi:DUF6624 domain-containing protein [Ornithinimicrobium cerasi]|uniref:Lipoprotein n=1 Tax=Ornithinimicrobium cerasi TaxID=2248773 RepID=A0A285VMA6_9MICO|nr:DUF6624 domain-containing protein [Ornithinimicrobium cerasi]SOC55215.1 hypothetical protein SAMN05421879_104274 [Ornithinimicrobium cerasi]